MSTNKMNSDRIIIFDTTLRDGEQSPGAAMTLGEKIEVAEFLIHRIRDGGKIIK